MLQNPNAVIERAEASSVSNTSIAQNKATGNFVARAYILALKDEVLHANW